MKNLLLFILISSLFQSTISLNSDPTGRAPALKKQLLSFHGTPHDNSDVCFTPSRFPSYKYKLNKTDDTTGVTYYMGIETQFDSYTLADVFGTFDASVGAFHFQVYFNCPNCQYDSRVYKWNVQDDKWAVGTTWAYYRWTGSNDTYYDGPNEGIAFTNCNDNRIN